MSIEHGGKGLSRGDLWEEKDQPREEKMFKIVLLVKQKEKRTAE
jgi:hypothetical protein